MTKSKKTNNAPDIPEMSFWDHLEVLRGSLFRSVLYLCAFSALGLIFKQQLFDVILAPAGGDFCVYRLLGWDFSMELVNIEVSAQFFVHLRAAFAVGLVLSFPLIIYELWKFIAPALYPKEKKVIRQGFVLASFLFYLGVLVAYFIVLPVCLQFFINYTVDPDIANTITIGSYMSIFTSTVLLIGLTFEFPTVALVLSRLGIISRDMLRKGRKIAFVVVLALSAIITPADPVSMFVLAIPLYLLYEFSILLCKSPENQEDTQ